MTRIRSGRIRKGLTLAIFATVGALSLSACGGIAALPLPGGVDTGDDARTYQVRFADVLDLVPNSLVKRNGVSVGKVVDVSVPKGGWTALVDIKVKNGVDLSDQSRAAIEQSSLLGEKYLTLTEPANADALPRQNPNVPIPIARTRTAADTESVLGALSLLYNGGGLNQLESIVTELNSAMGGRTVETKALLNDATAVMSGLNEQRDDITGAIEGLDQLATRTAKQTTQIDRVLKELPAGVAVLAQQRPQFVDMLNKLNHLGSVSAEVLGKSHDAMITDIKSLGASLPALAKSSDDIVTSFPVVDLFPFPDSLLPAVHGDSTSIYQTIDLRELNFLEAFGVGMGDPKYSPKANNYIPPDPNNPWVGGNKTKWGLPPLWNWNYPAVSLLDSLRGSASHSVKPNSSSRSSHGSHTSPGGMKPVPSGTQGILDGTAAAMGGGQ